MADAARFDEGACCVCYESFESTARAALYCGHVVCASCRDTLVEREHRLCPVCRRYDPSLSMAVDMHMGFDVPADQDCVPVCGPDCDEHCPCVLERLRAMHRRAVEHYMPHPAVRRTIDTAEEAGLILRECEYIDGLLMLDFGSLEVHLQIETNKTASLDSPKFCAAPLWLRALFG